MKVLALCLYSYSSIFALVVFILTTKYIFGKIIYVYNFVCSVRKKPFQGFYYHSKLSPFYVFPSFCPRKWYLILAKYFSTIWVSCVYWLSTRVVCKVIKIHLIWERNTQFLFRLKSLLSGKAASSIGLVQCSQSWHF